MADHRAEEIPVDPRPSTQTRHPWRATTRTMFAAVVAFAAMYGLIIQAAGLDSSEAWVSVSLAVTGAITRVMALPVVDTFIRNFLPWLAPDPRPAP